jgi:transposase
MWSVGLDVHQRSSTLCILDEHGKRVKQQQVRGSWQKVIELLGQLGHPFAICYEASCGYGALYDRLSGLAKRVVVAHPGHLRLIFRTKRKNDRCDAGKLAVLLFLDQVPPVYVPSGQMRSWRGLIEFRHRVMTKRTRCKNQLRSLLRGHGVAAVTGKRLWTQAGLRWLEHVELPTEAAALQRDLVCEQLSHLEKQIKRVERMLNRMGRAHPGVMLLRTIPGVGPRTSEAVVAYIDDPRRFSRTRKVGSYFGLVPCQDQSAAVNRLGHITRQGPSTVRKLLTEAAWQAIRRSRHVRAYFDRIQGGDPQRRKIALVATAHYLVRVMQAMLRTGQGWRYDDRVSKAA